ncbi:MAG: response regulator, partial [Elusimicrobia bacterium]|nr:response regulator [Elusimicrobiota bacterium]
MTSAHSILIVDDDHSGRTMLALILRQSGYKIKTAPGGVEALGILQNESFEWMITDARMLPVNGFDLSREAKRLRPNMRVLMVSAVSTETDIQG